MRSTSLLVDPHRLPPGCDRMLRGAIPVLVGWKPSLVQAGSSPAGLQYTTGLPLGKCLAPGPLGACSTLCESATQATCGARERPARRPVGKVTRRGTMGGLNPGYLYVVRAPGWPAMAIGARKRQGIDGGSVQQGHAAQGMCRGPRVRRPRVREDSDSAEALTDS